MHLETGIALKITSEWFELRLLEEKASTASKITNYTHMKCSYLVQVNFIPNNALNAKKNLSSNEMMEVVYLLYSPTGIERSNLD